VCLLKYMRGTNDMRIISDAIFPLIGGRFVQIDSDKIYKLAHRLKLI